MEDKYVITIAREFGSLGRPIAKRLSEILGIEFYDRDIVEAAAQKMNMPISVIGDMEEKTSSFFKMMFPLGEDTVERKDLIFETQQRIIQEFVEKGPCIIVGRCSDYILENEKNSIHVFIYAPPVARYKNCVEVLGMEPEKAMKMINEVDKARRAYHKRYAGFSVDDPKHKHIIVNSELLGVEGTAQLLADAARQRFHLK